MPSSATSQTADRSAGRGRDPRRVSLKDGLAFRQIARPVAGHPPGTPDLRPLRQHDANRPATVDPSRAHEFAMAVVRDAEAVVGSPIPIAAIEYVPDDSPYHEKCRRLAAYLATCLAGAAVASGRAGRRTRREVKRDGCDGGCACELS